MILRWAVLHARVRNGALGRFALRHGIVGAILDRSGFKAEVAITGNCTRGEDGYYHEGMHRIIHFPRLP